jgi:hypothetical protein
MTLQLQQVSPERIAFQILSVLKWILTSPRHYTEEAKVWPKTLIFITLLKVDKIHHSSGDGETQAQANLL